MALWYKQPGGSGYSETPDLDVVAVACLVVEESPFSPKY